jgi:hypothetical protein
MYGFYSDIYSNFSQNLWEGYILAALMAYVPLHSQHYILSVVFFCVGVMLETYESSIKTMHTPLTEVMNVLMSNKYLPPYRWSCIISNHIIYILSLLPPICLYGIWGGVSLHFFLANND